MPEQRARTQVQSGNMCSGVPRTVHSPKRRRGASTTPTFSEECERLITNSTQSVCLACLNCAEANERNSVSARFLDLLICQEIIEFCIASQFLPSIDFSKVFYLSDSSSSLPSYKLLSLLSYSRLLSSLHITYMNIHVIMNGEEVKLKEESGRVLREHLLYLEVPKHIFIT